MANPISSDRTVMRRSLLSSVLEILEQNARVQERQTLFEIGPVYIPQAGELLPAEKAILVMTMTGKRSHAHWQGSDKDELDFYDLKGIVEAMLQGLHLDQIYYETATSMPFHPGMCAALMVAGEQIGMLGQLHPLISERYAISTPILAARLDLEKMQSLAGTVLSQPVPAYPPVFEDLAVVVDEDILGEQIEAVIRKAGRKLIADVRLFDIYRGEQIGSGKKSLAYSIVYQASDRTLTDKEVSKIRSKIIFLLGKELNAELRS